MQGYGGIHKKSFNNLLFTNSYSSHILIISAPYIIFLILYNILYINKNLILASSLDSLDWKEYGTEAEIKQVLNHKHLGNGSIILFHNDAKYTPEALDTIIKGLKEKGYEIVPVSELIIRDNYSINNEGRQIANNTSCNDE